MTSVQTRSETLNYVKVYGKIKLLVQAYKLTASWYLVQILKSCAQTLSEGVKALRPELNVEKDLVVCEK